MSRPVLLHGIEFPRTSRLPLLIRIAQPLQKHRLGVLTKLRRHERTGLTAPIELDSQPNEWSAHAGTIEAVEQPTLDERGIGSDLIQAIDGPCGDLPAGEYCEPLGAG